MSVELEKATEHFTIQMDPSIKGNGKVGCVLGMENIPTLMATGIRELGNRT
jgi:hypothetical protein